MTAPEYSLHELTHAAQQIEVVQRQSIEPNQNSATSPSDTELRNSLANMSDSEIARIKWKGFFRRCLGNYLFERLFGASTRSGK
ncbi:hypothetical protein [Scytonema sp. NUACC21]